MSAASLGQQLLGEVEEETLDQVLRSLRDITATAEPSIGIPTLDTVIDAFKHPQSTRQQEALYTEQGTASSTKDKTPTVIEITGVSPCSGKTQLLYYISAIALLPPTVENVAVNGKGQAVALFDLAGNFSILRLRDIMSNYIVSQARNQDTDLSDEIMTSTITDSLLHLHVFSCSSTPSLLSTLSLLPSDFLSLPSQHYSSPRPLGLLALIDLSTFFHHDRRDAEEASLQSPHPNMASAPENLLTNRYRSLVQHLRSISSTFSCITIATNLSLSSPSQVRGKQALRPHLPSVWNNFCTFRLVVERERVPKFGPEISVQEAAGERARRWEALRKAGFRAWINWWGAEGWREEVREGVERLERGGGFAFQVTKEGVSIEADER